MDMKEWFVAADTLAAVMSLTTGPLSRHPRMTDEVSYALRRRPGSLLCCRSAPLASDSSDGQRCGQLVQDHAQLQLVLTFLRNLLTIPDEPPGRARGALRGRMQVRQERRPVRMVGA